MNKMAYLAGLVASDGNLSRYNYRVKIVTSSKEFADYLLSMTHDLFRCHQLHNKIELYCYNKRLWLTLNEVYNIPAGKKSYIVEPPKHMTPQESLDYLRGVLDGDGSVFTVMTKLRRRREYRYVLPRLAYKSKSYSMVSWSKTMLEKYEMTPYFSNQKNFWRWYLDGFTNLIKFKRKIGFCHPEKRNKLEQILKQFGDLPKYYAPVAGDGVRNSSPAEEGGPEN